MNMKGLILLLSAVLLTSSCHRAEQRQSTTKVTNDTPSVSASSITGNVNTPTTQLSQQEIDIAQKEFMMILSIKDGAMVEMNKLVAAYSRTKPNEHSVKEFQDKAYNISLDVKRQINALKITNQDIKNYITAFNELSALNEKMYANQDTIEKEQRNGKFSKANDQLLKDVQMLTGKLLQQDFILTEKLGQSGIQNPISELLQLKGIHDKAIIQLVRVAQVLSKDTSSNADREKKLVDTSQVVLKNTVAELSKLSVKIPEIDEYRKKLVAVRTLEIGLSSEKIQQEIRAKKLSPDSKRMIDQIQIAVSDAEQLRIALTAKYSK